MTFEEVIKKRGFTQESLGTKMNKSHTTIYRWCKGKSEPSCADLIKLSKIINVKIESLVKYFANKGGDHSDDNK